MFKVDEKTQKNYLQLSNGFMESKIIYLEDLIYFQKDANYISCYLTVIILL